MEPCPPRTPHGAPQGGEGRGEAAAAVGSSTLQPGTGDVGGFAVPEARARPPGAGREENPAASARRSKTSAVTGEGLPCPRWLPVPEPSAPVPGKVQGQQAALDELVAPPIRRRNPDKMPRRAITGTPRGNACLARHGAGLGKPGRPRATRPEPAGECQPGGTRGTVPAPGRDTPGYRADGGVGTRMARRFRGDPSPQNWLCNPPHRALAPVYSPCTALGSISGGR